MESLLTQSGSFEDQMHFLWAQSPLCYTEGFEFLGIFIIAELCLTVGVSKFRTARTLLSPFLSDKCTPSPSPKSVCTRKAREILLPQKREIATAKPTSTGWSNWNTQFGTASFNCCCTIRINAPARARPCTQLFCLLSPLRVSSATLSPAQRSPWANLPSLQGETATFESIPLQNLLDCVSVLVHIYPSQK